MQGSQNRNEEKMKRAEIQTHQFKTQDIEEFQERQLSGSHGCHFLVTSQILAQSLRLHRSQTNVPALA